MIGAIETSTALYLYNAEPSMTAISARDTQCRELVIKGEMWRHLTRRMALPTSNERKEATGETAAPFGVVSTSIGRVVSPEEPKTQADRAIAQLLRFDSLDTDWDGNEAAKPLAYSVEEARGFIRALAPESIIPRPALHADGHTILFARGDDTYVELEFLGQHRIGFYARRGEREWSEEFYFDGRTLPAGLSQVGFVI